MPAPNDVEIVRVYTRNPGGEIADVQFHAAAKYEVVVEAECGSTLHGNGGPYWIGVTVSNLTDVTASVKHDIAAATFGAPLPDWEKFAHQQVFGPFDSDWPGGQTGVHVYQVYAWVKARKVDPNVSLVGPHLFLVYEHEP